MTSEDWKTVLLAAITTFGGIATMFILGYLEILRRKANENAEKIAHNTVVTEKTEKKVDAVTDPVVREVESLRGAMTEHIGKCPPHVKGFGEVLSESQTRTNGATPPPHD